MKEIGRRAWDLLRANPVLWLPVIVADLVAQATATCMTMIDQAIYSAMTTGSRSVLGGPPDAPSLLSARVTETVFLTLPVIWGSYFVRTLAFACALVASGILVWGLERKSPVGAAVVWEAVRSRLGRSARFAGVLIGFCFVFMVAILGGLSRLLMALDRTSVLAKPAFAYGTTLVGMAALSWLMAPRALRLARADGATEPDRRTKHLARAFTMCAALVSSVIYLGDLRLWQEIAGPTHRLPSLSGHLYFGVVSLLCALPYAALSVVMAMMGLGRGDEGDSGEKSEAEIVALSGDGDAAAGLPEEREHLGDNGV